MYNFSHVSNKSSAAGNSSYGKKYKYDAQNRSQSLVLCYIWSESMFRNTAPPFAPPKNAPPFAPL